MRRSRCLLGLFIATGLTSLALSAFAADMPGSSAAQLLLLVLFFIGALLLIMGRLPRAERMRWLAVIVPSLLLMAIGIWVAPHLAGIFLGAGTGWIVAGLFIFRGYRGPQQYKKAVKAMRRKQYDDAIAAMDVQIAAEPKQPEHYRFRAEIQRLAGNTGEARRDYQRMIALAPDSPVAHNGLAELELQFGRYDAARQAAQTALKLAPQEWVAAYNLGLICDRLRDSDAVIEHLSQALAAKIPDSRHRLLTHLYLWRAQRRLKREADAAASLRALKKEKVGLQEWQLIMGAEEAQALRAVLSEDIDQARQLITGEKGA